MGLRHLGVRSDGGVARARTRRRCDLGCASLSGRDRGGSLLALRGRRQGPAHHRPARGAAGALHTRGRRRHRHPRPVRIRIRVRNAPRSGRRAYASVVVGGRRRARSLGGRVCGVRLFPRRSWRRPGGIRRPARQRSITLPRGGDLLEARDRAHSARHRPSALRARAHAARARVRPAGQDDHRVHSGPQRHARRVRARLHPDSPRPHRGRHRALHRVARS